MSQTESKYIITVSCLVYDRVGEEYSEPQPAVCFPRGTDLLELWLQKQKIKTLFMKCSPFEMV